MTFFGIGPTTSAIFTGIGVLVFSLLIQYRIASKATIISGYISDVKIDWWSKHNSRYGIVTVKDQGRIVAELRTAIYAPFSGAKSLIGTPYRVYKIPTGTGYRYRLVKNYYFVSFLFAIIATVLQLYLGFR